VSEGGRLLEQGLVDTQLVDTFLMRASERLDWEAELLERRGRGTANEATRMSPRELIELRAEP